MLDPNIKIAHTAHTNNKVPFIVADNNFNMDNKIKLSDIAPVILKIMELN